MDYMWIDNQKKQVRLPAPQYVGSSPVLLQFRPDTSDFIMTNISNRIINEKFFPTKHNSQFPPNFQQSIVKVLHKQMFRVFAHVYWAHFEVSHSLFLCDTNVQTIIHLRLEAHWNSFFAHFISFAKVCLSFGAN